MTAPVLTTERLILSPPRAEDQDDHAALWADPGVVRFIGGTVRTAEESWIRLTALAGSWLLSGCGYWVVRSRDDGRFVGQVGFAINRRDLATDVAGRFSGVPEAGWVLSPAAHGRGYAAEAMTAALDWIDQDRAAPRTVCLIHPDNAASMRVAERAGYVRFALTDYHGGPTVLLERLRPA